MKNCLLLMGVVLFSFSFSASASASDSIDVSCWSSAPKRTQGYEFYGTMSGTITQNSPSQFSLSRASVAFNILKRENGRWFSWSTDRYNDENENHKSELVKGKPVFDFSPYFGLAGVSITLPKKTEMSADSFTVQLRVNPENYDYSEALTLVCYKTL